MNTQIFAAPGQYTLRIMSETNQRIYFVDVDQGKPGPANVTGFFIIRSILLGFIFGALGGCEGLPKNVADRPVTPTPPANLSIAPPVT